jgi:hypothetical protein
VNKLKAPSLAGTLAATLAALMGSTSPAVVNALTIKNLPCGPAQDWRALHGLAISPAALAARALSADKRDAKCPDIPTRKERGHPEFQTWVGSAFPMRAETPDEVVNKRATAIRQVMNSEAGRAYHASLPSMPRAMGPMALGEFQRREFERCKRVADAAGTQPE